jgi:hypothetical protein
MLVRFVGCTLLLVLLGGSPASGQTFSDDSFDPGDWTLQVVGAGTVDAVQQLAGGNPDAFREVTNRPTPAMGENVQGWHLHTGFVYDPSAAGALESVGWSIDFQNLTTGQAAALALEQDGVLMQADFFITTPDRPGWFTHDASGVLAGDFSAGGPDFSSSGGPIAFGFLTSNTFDPAAGDIDNDVAYDNLAITLVPVPEPTAIALLAVAAAVLGARAARRA